MTSKSKVRELEAHVRQCLDNANQDLPDVVRQDISQARIQALAQAKLYSSDKKSPLFAKALELFGYIFSDNLAKLGGPLAVAVIAAVLVSYRLTDTIPAFPGELLTADVPMEDFALLEELEFANWLAEQQEVLR